MSNTKESQNIEFLVKPYPYPVSYKGQYHYRSGSTKQELKGAALDQFLLQKQGITWDSVVIPSANITDISNLNSFRKLATNSKRLDIANVFFRAGLIEALGRGIEKMSTACKDKGLQAPEIECEKNGIMTIAEIANTLQISARAVEKNLKKLQENKKLSRIGAKKDGHWKVL